MLYGGGVGGGKSILEHGIINHYAMKYAGTRYAIIRKTFGNLLRTSIPSFKKVLSFNKCIHRGENCTLENLVKFNMSNYIAVYPNGSEVLFIHCDKKNDPDFDKLKGLEVTMAMIEEAQEIDEGAWATVITRVGRWKNDKYNIKPIILLNCNPSRNWVKRVFYDPWNENRLEAPYYFLQALPQDNPHNSQDYLDSLEMLPEAEYKRYVLGDWDYSDDPDQLILYEWIKDCINTDLDKWCWDKRDNRVTSIGVDVAREGNDKTVISLMSGNRLVKQYSMKHYRHYEIANEIINYIDGFQFKEQIGVDAVGLGSGTVDALHEKGVSCFEFKGGYSADDKRDKYTSYKNLRAQAYWELREDIQNGDIEIPDDKELIQELLNIRYKVDERVISIEEKTKYKSRYGNSPDKVDSLVIANYMRKRDTISFKKYANNLSNIPNTQIALLDL